jgi:hypothetical protein
MPSPSPSPFPRPTNDEHMLAPQIPLVDARKMNAAINTRGALVFESNSADADVAHRLARVMAKDEPIYRKTARPTQVAIYDVFADASAAAAGVTTDPLKRPACAVISGHDDLETLRVSCLYTCSWNGAYPIYIPNPPTLAILGFMARSHPAAEGECCNLVLALSLSAVHAAGESLFPLDLTYNADFEFSAKAMALPMGLGCCDQLELMDAMKLTLRALDAIHQSALRHLPADDICRDSIKCTTSVPVRGTDGTYVGVVSTNIAYPSPLADKIAAAIVDSVGEGNAWLVGVVPILAFPAPSVQTSAAQPGASHLTLTSVPGANFDAFAIPCSSDYPLRVQLLPKEVKLAAPIATAPSAKRRKATTK